MCHIFRQNVPASNTDDINLILTMTDDSNCTWCIQCESSEAIINQGKKRGIIIRKGVGVEKEETGNNG